jgi:hypothetical protein
MTSPDLDRTSSLFAHPLPSWTCAFVDPELDEAIVAEMDAVFSMERMFGPLDADIRTVRRQPPALPRVYHLAYRIARRDDIAWLARDDILALVDIYRSSAGTLAERLPPEGVDPDPAHLDEDLCNAIRLFSEHSEDPAVAARIEAAAAARPGIAWIAEQERLKRDLERQVIGPLTRPQFDRFGDMPSSLAIEILGRNLLSPACMWRCHLFRAGMLKRCRVIAPGSADNRPA